MNEAKAWVRLAQLWSKAVQFDLNHPGEYAYRNWYSVGGEDRVYGLCLSIYNLRNRGEISFIIEESMKDKIYAIKKWAFSPFVWDTTTREGRDQRIEFCWEQARLLEEGGVAHEVV